MQVQSVAEELFFTTLRISTTGPNGEQGSGTGFFFEYCTDGVSYPFVVTNKHVVEGTVDGMLPFTKQADGRPALGESYEYREPNGTWPQIWFGHPDPSIDIAVTPLMPIVEAARTAGAELFIRAVSSTDIPSSQRLAAMDALSTITFVGYPNGIWDQANRLPIARRGMVATPLVVDYEGSPRFLIDASVFGGSSGSPVFILKEEYFKMKSGVSISDDPGVLFLGVVAAVYFRTALNEIVPVPIPTQVQPMAKQQEMLDLGIVFKSSTVMEAVEAFLRARGVAFVPAGAG